MQGDMEALGALVGRVEVGWTVDVTNHDYIKDSGVRVIESLFTTPDQTYRWKGEDHLMRKGGPGYIARGRGKDRRAFRYQFPVEGDDFEVEGDTLKIFNPSHAYVYGNRAITLTLVFRPPSA